MQLTKYQNVVNCICCSFFSFISAFWLFLFQMILSHFASAKWHCRCIVPKNLFMIFHLVKVYNNIFPRAYIFFGPFFFLLRIVANKYGSQWVSERHEAQNNEEKKKKEEEPQKCAHFYHNKLFNLLIQMAIEYKRAMIVECFRICLQREKEKKGGSNYYPYMELILANMHITHIICNQKFKWNEEQEKRTGSKRQNEWTPDKWSRNEFFQIEWVIRLFHIRVVNTD